MTLESPANGDMYVGLFFLGFSFPPSLYFLFSLSLSHAFYSLFLQLSFSSFSLLFSLYHTRNTQSVSMKNVRVSNVGIYVYVHFFLFPVQEYETTFPQYFFDHIRIKNCKQQKGNEILWATQDSTLALGRLLDI